MKAKSIILLLHDSHKNNWDVLLKYIKDNGFFSSFGNIRVSTDQPQFKKKPLKTIYTRGDE